MFLWADAVNGSFLKTLCPESSGYHIGQMDPTSNMWNVHMVYIVFIIKKTILAISWRYVC